MSPTIEQIQEAMRLGWETGRLAYKLQAPQHEPYDLFYRSKLARRDVWVAGRRCKKSTLMLILHAETCIKNEVQTLYVAPVEKGLSAYIAPIIRDVFADCPEDLLPSYSEKHNHLLFPQTGSRVIFNGCNMRQYRYMRGQKVALGTVDEMSEVDDLFGAVDDVLYPATWDSNGKIILSGTPPPIPDPESPVMVYVAAAKAAKSYWHASVYDAGYSHDKIAEALRETSKGAISESESFQIVKLCAPANGYSLAQIYEVAEKIGVSKEALTVFVREFLAEFVRDESAVIVPEFDERAHVQVIPKPVYYDLLYKGSGADLGVADKTIEVFGYYDFPKARVVVEKEFSIEGADVRTDIFAKRHGDSVKDLGWIDDRRATYWSDNSNLMLLNDLAALHKIHISPTDKEDKAQWLNLLRIMFKRGQILIDPSLKLLIATLNGAFWKDATKKDYGRSKSLGHMDALDALVYFVRNLNMNGNPFPINYDINRGVVFDPATHVYPPDWNKRAHTEEGRVLERVFGKNRFARQHDGPPLIGGL